MPIVALTDPMKRGLKVRCYQAGARVGCHVALTDPMKRGLKVGYKIPIIKILSCTHCPDEKGTESILCLAQSLQISGCTHCRDEKGTESSNCELGVNLSHELHSLTR